jgi:hypothetical protein
MTCISGTDFGFEDAACEDVFAATHVASKRYIKILLFNGVIKEVIIEIYPFILRG